MSIDDLNGLSKTEQEKIKKWQRITDEKGSGDAFAKAQFNIGSVYHENDKLESALKAWNKIKPSDNLELYSQLRVDIGTMFEERDDSERALIEWEKVERLDNAEAYARAQFYISNIYDSNGDKDNTLLALKNIKRSDDPSLYAKAQLNIGFIFFERKDEERAISAWKNVKRSDSGKSYAEAQIRIGNTSHKNKDSQGALDAWTSIISTDDNKLYANAQFNIGNEYQTIGDTEAALDIWSQITRSNNSFFYSMAQFNIGTMLKRQNNYEGALLAWQNVEYSNDVDSYTRAQFNIANTLRENGKEDDSLFVLRNIKRSDSCEMYAKAQLNIGYSLSDKGDVQGALLAWNSIERSDNLETYARAKIIIGFLLEKRLDYDGAIAAWSKIERSDNPEAYAVAKANIAHLSFEKPIVAKKAFLNIRKADNPRIYAHAQFKLGLIFINENNIEEAANSFNIAKSYYPYESYCCEKICDLLKVSETKSFGLSLLQLLNIVLDIVDILTLDFSKYADEEKPFERKLAHYTSTATANLLLKSDKEKNLPSAFRLNTINNVNDPSEGQLLIRKLKGIKGNNFTALDFNKELHAFISCFTFNHDSLNQFRLYGKQDNKEASGMSLVFKKEFFQPTKFIEGLSYVWVENTSKTIKNISNINDAKLDNVEVQASDNEEVVKYSVMRCVYLDPTSDYIHLAQRNRLTFFREFSDKRIMKNGIEQSQAEYEWYIYQEYIKIITNDFEVAYENLQSTYKEVETETENVRFDPNSLEHKELSNLVDEILLPLKYLIKHSAFREEQECRMIYITSIDRPEVTMEYGSVLYVEYEPSVKQHLDKIYIAPAALQHKRYFDYLLEDIDVPVEVSGNVFR